VNLPWRKEGRDRQLFPLAPGYPKKRGKKRTGPTKFFWVAVKKKKKKTRTFGTHEEKGGGGGKQPNLFLPEGSIAGRGNASVGREEKKKKKRVHGPSGTQISAKEKKEIVF